MKTFTINLSIPDKGADDIIDNITDALGVVFHDLFCCGTGEDGTMLMINDEVDWEWVHPADYRIESDFPVIRSEKWH